MYLDFLTDVHQSTKRDYLSRINHGKKAEYAALAKKFDYDYWDGSRDTGYGGYKYDGRWRPVAQKMVDYYKLKPGHKILDVGCGKGFLLYEFTQIVPGIQIQGIDISNYAIEHAKEEVKPFLKQGSAISLPFPDQSFDFLVSINTLHNLYLPDLHRALKEVERVAKKKYILMDGYRNDQEKINLMCWQLTCECFFTPQEWEWIFKQSGYTGDYGLIYFE